MAKIKDKRGFFAALDNVELGENVSFMFATVTLA